MHVSVEIFLIQLGILKGRYKIGYYQINEVVSISFIGVKY